MAYEWRDAFGSEGSGGFVCGPRRRVRVGRREICGDAVQIRGGVLVA